jgi:oligoribonuclease (3'-5' exoribonuclease)
MERIPPVEAVAEVYDVACAAVVAAVEARSAAIIAEKEAIAAMQYAGIAHEKVEGVVDSVKNSTFVYANASDDALVIFLGPVYFLEIPNWLGVARPVGCCMH